VIDLTDFSWERHEVTTDDGYINTLYRIYQDSPEDKPAVLFQHGILATSDDFVIAPPGQGPAFVAAEAGYDVWLGNSRGNRYSLKHETLNSYIDTSYWEHSFAEIGKYDLPAFLSFITEETGNKKVSIVAHSQGTTATFYGMAKRPEFYREHVNLFIALAPVAKMSRMEPLTAIVARFLLDHLSLVKFFNLHVLLPYTRFNPVPTLCWMMPKTCLAAMHYLDTSDTQMLDH
jgi:lysosomal acid lipase/cholesteryl ester hydrolase